LGTEVDRVIAVGGDGTLNEVLAGLVSLDRPATQTPALGFLPAGTANAAVQAFGLSKDVEDVARALPTAPVRSVDVGMVRFEEKPLSGEGGMAEERPFLLWCGAGFDAVLIAEVNTSRTGHMGLMGLVRSTPGVVRALVRYPAPPIRTRIDDHDLGDACSVILTNVATVGFGGRVVATADPFDGQIDVVSIDPAPWPKLVRLALRMLGSGLSGAAGARHQLATRVHLSSEGNVPVQLDGEPVGSLPISVRLRAGAVRLLMT
jgi:diacylglycerol kinase family enzyme